MPAGLEMFPSFAKLNYDLRYQIWESAIYIPGIHFLKFEQNHLVSESSAVDDYETDDGSDHERETYTEAEKENRFKYTAHLTPLFPTPDGDMSYYIEASKTYARLSMACDEAAEMINAAIAKPDTLKLDNGRLITLAGSGDVICIDYPEKGDPGGLGRWASKLDVAQLAKIRRLAVRYHPLWDGNHRVCRLCGRRHEFGQRQAVLRHLFEFAAQFTNLERFYFVDHLIVRKPQNQDQHGAKHNSRWLSPLIQWTLADKESSTEERFASGGRRYYEADPSTCTINTKVFTTLEWVKENLISHCENKQSQKPPIKNPRGVRFGVLACEWQYEAMRPKKGAIPKISKKRAAPRPTLKRRSPNLSLVDTLDGLSLETEQIPVFRDGTAEFGITFGSGDASGYRFDFETKL